MSLVWQLMRAELLKIRTTRTVWFIYGGLALLLVLLLVLALASTEAKELRGEQGVRSILPAGAQVAYLFALCLGVIGMAGEYRHDTIGHSLLAAPKRWQIVLAKLAAYFVAGLVVGVLAAVVTYGIAGPWMSSKDAGFSFDNILPREILVGTVLGCGCFGAIGVGLGAVLKEQVLSLFVGVGFSLVVYGIVSGPAPGFAKFLPTGALDAFVHATGEDFVSWEAGFLVLMGYVVVLGAVGTYLVRGRDLT